MSDHHRMARPGAGDWPIGARMEVPFTGSGEIATVRVLAVPERDLVREGRLSPALSSVSDGILVDVTAAGRTVLPGAWVDRAILEGARPVGQGRVPRRELRFPAVVVGEGQQALLLWGETAWPLPLTADVGIPAACRPALHRTADLRRLILAALGRRGEVGLTTWQDPGFDVPWHDVRLHPRARWWFDIAGIGDQRTYRRAAADCAVPVESLPGAWA